MHLAFYEEPSCLLVKLQGELDLSTAAKFREAVEKELRREALPNLVLNLRALNFIDSTGMGVILGRHKEISSLGGKMILTEVPPKILSMLEMAGLSNLITIVKKEEDALKLVRDGKPLDERRF